MPFVMWRRRTRRRRRKWRATNTNSEGNNVLASRIPFKQSACAAAVMKCPSIFFPLHLSPSLSVCLSVSLSLWSHPLSPCRCIFDADMLMHLASTWLPLLAASQNMLHFLCREYPVRFQFGWLHTHQIRQCCKSKSKSSWEIEWHLYGVCPSQPPSRLSLLCSAWTVALTVLSWAMQKKYISCFFHQNAQQNVRANYRSLLRILRDGWGCRTRARNEGMERKKEGVA